MPRNDLPLRAPQGPPMTLANMRKNGVRMIWAKCEACGHQADVNVDTLAETLVALRWVNACAVVVAGASRSTPGPLGTQGETCGGPGGGGSDGGRIERAVSYHRVSKSRGRRRPFRKCR
jgi:hypothetical protein